MSHRRFLILGTGLLVMFVVMNFLIKKYMQSVELASQSKPLVYEPAPAKSLNNEGKQGKRRYHHQPVDPAKYGIVTIRDEDMPQNQEQWDIYIEQVFERTKFLEQPYVKPALEKMAVTPEKYNEDMQRLDQEIVKYSQNDSPDTALTTEEAHERAQMLRMLKAVAGRMKDKVAVSSGTPPETLKQ